MMDDMLKVTVATIAIFALAGLGQNGARDYEVSFIQEAPRAAGWNCYHIYPIPTDKVHAVQILASKYSTTERRLVGLIEYGGPKNDCHRDDFAIDKRAFDET
jgi:hypothetical protein